MDSTLQIIFEVATAVAMIVIAALNALAAFAIGWAVYHMLRDHWSVRQVWQHARARLSL